MCRYAFKRYKRHYACFACRKAFRVRPTEEWADANVRSGSVTLVVKCPDCGHPMHEMGLDFKAPRKKNRKQWKKVEVLHAAGITFGSCGCGGPGYRPRTMREVPEFLAEQQKRRLETVRSVRPRKLKRERKRDAA